MPFIKMTSRLSTYQQCAIFTLRTYVTAENNTEKEDKVTMLLEPHKKKSQNAEELVAEAPRC